MKAQRVRPTYLIFLIIIPLLLVFILAGIFSSPKSLQAKHGVLDLVEWDFSKNGVVKLDGEWEFYWKQLLTYDDFHRKTATLSCYGKVPSVWNYFRPNGRRLPGFGYATYRLKVKIKNPKALMGLKIATMSTAYKLMVNNRVIASNGRVGAHPKTFSPGYRPQLCDFKTTANEFEIIIQVANFTYARGGAWSSIYMGTGNQIHALNENNKHRNLLLLGSLLIMIFYHAGLFILQRKYRSRAALSFILIMILFGVHFGFHDEYLVLDIFPGLSMKALVLCEYLAIYWTAPALLLFIRRLYPDECTLLVLKLALCIASLFSLITLIAPIAFFTQFTLLIELIALGYLIYCSYVALIATLSKRVSAPLLFSAFIFTFGAVILELLYNWNICHYNLEGGIFPIVAFVFIFAQSFILAQRSSAAYHEIETLSEQLIALNKQKDEFLANTSHELRTPLHGIINITEFILQTASSGLSPQHRENLALVAATGKRLVVLVNDILDYEKLKHGDIQLKIQSLDIRQAIMVVLEIAKYLLFNKPVTLTCRLPEDLPPIMADENRFTQIVYNLLGNAVKFTDVGTITISAVQNGDMLEISVADTGIGIPADKIGTIFDSFEQLGSASRENYDGTGLGLSIAKNLVTIQDGEIWVISKPGKGSTFTFSMPVASVQPNQAVSKVPINYDNPQLSLIKPPGVMSKANDFTVLAVDDDYVNLQVLINILAYENCTVITATDGMAALEILAGNRQIDLVILDVMLPKISGYEVCRKIRQKYSRLELPIIIMTAQKPADSHSIGFEAGANDFLSKPFEANELRARIKTLLNLKRSVSQAIRSEMAFLQAQIKPHFLYNALNTIVAFCWTDPEKAAQLLQTLGDYLRGSFNFNNMAPFISLGKELEYVQAYITIEKARFGEKINFQMNIAVSLDIIIPTLVIQPLVENAIKHGILPKPKGGAVILAVQRQNQDIIITISDDGVGIAPAKLNQILADTPAVRDSHGVGFINVNSRIKRLYGYGIEISSEIMKGTIITIKIPGHGKELPTDVANYIG